jgi:hypothetical protein
MALTQVLILFDNEIQVKFPFTQLTDCKRLEILEFIETIKRRNSTNIYDAIEKGMELIQ